jgi:hypothetical protein
MIFPGSFYKPKAPLWARLPASSRRVFETALEIALGAEFIPALEALDQAMARFGGHLPRPTGSRCGSTPSPCTSRFRERRPLRPLKAMARTEYPLQVVGSGYDRDLYRFRNVTLLGERDLSEVIGLMRRSRVVLSANANFGRGSHERPLTAMVAGAVAVTDASAFYADSFGQDALFQYHWASLDTDLQALVVLMGDPARLFGMASRGHAQACAGHRWDNRVPAILAAAAGVRAAA